MYAKVREYRSGAFSRTTRAKFFDSKWSCHWRYAELHFTNIGYEKIFPNVYSLVELSYFDRPTYQAISITPVSGFPLQYALDGADAPWDCVVC